MLAFILRRLLLTVPVLWIVVTLVFGLIHMVPGDPIAQMLGEGASTTEVERLRHDLGLDEPLLTQYRTYISGVLHGDLGNSFRNQEPVARSIRTRSIAPCGVWPRARPGVLPRHAGPGRFRCREEPGLHHDRRWDRGDHEVRDAQQRRS